MAATAIAASLPSGTERALRAAVRRARSRGRALVSFTVAAGGLDPAAVVLASRRAREPWFVFEQPDRHRSALACLGCACSLEAAGDDRFARVGAEWRALAGEAITDAPDALVAAGGFAFAPDGGGA